MFYNILHGLRVTWIKEKDKENKAGNEKPFTVNGFVYILKP